MAGVKCATVIRFGKGAYLIQWSGSAKAPAETNKGNIEVTKISFASIYDLVISYLAKLKASVSSKRNKAMSRDASPKDIHIENAKTLFGDNTR